MKVLVVGGQGQLGKTLGRTVPSNVECVVLSRGDIDITQEELLKGVVAKIAPDVILNAAAYTAVDKAEFDSKTAYAVNAQGAANLAKAAKNSNARLIHLSTDYVFDGCQSVPYHPKDATNPLGVYGKSKLEGERWVSEILGDDALIIRTSWVYSIFGNNFVKTMLRLMQEKDSLGIVADQIGSPTWTGGLALAIWKSVACKPTGIFHWSDAGVASWYDFAHAIQEEGLQSGFLKKTIPLLPITSDNYPTPAQRPPYTVLDKSDIWRVLGYTADHWRVGLRKMFQELKVESNHG